MAKGKFRDGSTHVTRELGELLVVGDSHMGTNYRLVKFLNTGKEVDIRVPTIIHLVEYAPVARIARFGKRFKTNNSGDLITIEPIDYTSDYNSRYMDVQFVNTGAIRRRVPRGSVTSGRVLDSANVPRPRYRRRKNTKYGIGTVHETCNYGKIEIIDYDTCSNLRRVIRFINTGTICTRSMSTIASGRLKDHSVKTGYPKSKCKVGSIFPTLKYGNVEIIQPRVECHEYRDVRFLDTGNIEHNVDIARIYNKTTIDSVAKLRNGKYGNGKVFVMHDGSRLVVTGRGANRNYRKVKPLDGHEWEGVVHIDNLKNGKYPKRVIGRL